MSEYICVYVDHILHKKINTNKIMFQTYYHLAFRELINDACGEGGGGGTTLDLKRVNR